MSGKGFLQGLTLAACMLLAASCAITKYVPQGEYLLDRNTVEIDRTVPRNERIKAEEFDQYLRQRSNKRFLGMRVPLSIYNFSNPNRRTWWSRAWRRVGEPPVLLDTVLVQRSAESMQAYMRTRGFFNAVEHYTIDTARKRASVTYHATQGEPYYIAAIRYDFQDRFLRPVVMQDSAKTLLHTGNVFDINVLDRERTRITENLRRQGYYNFSINNISYIADSTVADRRVNLTMVVKQYLSRYDSDGMPRYENNAVYRLRNISIYPGYNPTAAGMLSRPRLDTLKYRELNILYEGKPRVRERILRQAVNLYPNYLYNADEVKKSYDNIMRLGYFKSVSITEMPDTITHQVTFIGSGDDRTEPHTISQGYLDCTILCTPALRQSYKIDFEATSTSSFYGLALTLGYQNRNLFRGAERFDVSLTYGYEFMRAKGRTSSFEIGGATSFSFPRFITPWRIDRFGWLTNPVTKIELSINSQRRPYYERVLSRANWGYSWGNGKHSTFTLRPADVSLVRMLSLDEKFLDNLQNPYLKNSYSSQLIAGISGSYVFNNQISRIDRNTLSWRVNWETTGNMLNTLQRLFSGPVMIDTEEYYRIFGIRFAQYVRADASFSYKMVLNVHNSLVYRIYAGMGHAYGNSSSLPFDRFFYAGGSNSMRAWLARTLGPGESAARPREDYPAQFGSMKLETNLEYRFPVWDVLKGALFFDAGNVWFTHRTHAPDEAVFRFSSFFSQLGFNSGIGARFDFNFFVVRADWGIRIHDPGQPAGQRWIHGFKFSNTAINFGVGYPF